MASNVLANVFPSSTSRLDSNWPSRPTSVNNWLIFSDNRSEFDDSNWFLIFCSNQGVTAWATVKSPSNGNWHFFNSCKQVWISSIKQFWQVFIDDEILTSNSIKFVRNLSKLSTTPTWYRGKNLTRLTLNILTARCNWPNDLTNDDGESLKALINPSGFFFRNINKMKDSKADFKTECAR